MIRQEYKCDFEKCRHNVHGKCCRLRFDLCKYHKAKEIIQNIIRVTWGEGWNYSLDWKEKAEQFLQEADK